MRKKEHVDLFPKENKLFFITTEYNVCGKKEICVKNYYLANLLSSCCFFAWRFSKSFYHLELQFSCVFVKQ